MTFSILNFVEYLKKLLYLKNIKKKKKIDYTYIYNLLHPKHRFSLKINSEFSFIIFFKLTIHFKSVFLILILSKLCFRF